MPAFLMSDAPLDADQAFAALNAPNGDEIPLDKEVAHPDTGVIATALLDDCSPEELRYEPRVSIVSAYRFQGQVHLAPTWVDRNWIGYDDGPVLRVCTPDGVDIGCAKVGDWIVSQDVKVDKPGGGFEVEHQKTVVISQSEFSRLYRVTRK